MKKIGKLKLNQLNKKELETKQMNVLKGGCTCGCSGNCSCTSYPPDGMPNSQNNSSFFYNWNQDTTSGTMSG